MFKSSGKVAIEKKHHEQDQPTWTKFTKNNGEVQVGKKAQTVMKENAKETPQVIGVDGDINFQK
jgi:hypothetical protein